MGKGSANSKSCRNRMREAACLVSSGDLLPNLLEHAISDLLPTPAILHLISVVSKPRATVRDNCRLA